MTKKLNLNYSNNLYLDVYLPINDNYKTIIYFHGGGLCSGDKTDPQYLNIAEQFVNNGYCFVSVNYSLYPAAKFPIYICDCANAIKYVFNNVKTWGGSEDIYVAGQSAGAWIALMLCCNKEYLINIGVDPLDVKGWISDSAQTTSHFNVISREDGLSNLCQRIDEKAPLYFLNPEFKSNPILLIYYQDDMPNRLQQNELFYSSIKSFNRNIDIQKIMLSGCHCHGSSFANIDGTFDFVNVSLDWLVEH